MSEVYLVLGRGHDRLEALEILDRDASRSPRLRNKFRMEAAVAAQLVHPNIVSVHEHGEFEHQLWMSMHYVDDYTAARLVARGQIALDVSRVARIVAEVAKGLDHAHSQGVVHRDVKPANILISTERIDGYEQVLLSDWGIARLLGDSTPLAAGGTVLASIPYAAPELLRGGVLSAQTDVYGLGATLVELATGRPPYPLATPLAITAAHLTAEPPSVTRRRRALPRGARRGGREGVGEGSIGSLPNLRRAQRRGGGSSESRSSGTAAATIAVHAIALAEIFLTDRS